MFISKVTTTATIASTAMLLAYLNARYIFPMSSPGAKMILSVISLAMILVTHKIIFPKGEWDQKVVILVGGLVLVLGGAGAIGLAQSGAVTSENVMQCARIAGYVTIPIGVWGIGVGVFRSLRFND